MSQPSRLREASPISVKRRAASMLMKGTGLPALLSARIRRAWRSVSDSWSVPAAFSS